MWRLLGDLAGIPEVVLALPSFTVPEATDEARLTLSATESAALSPVQGKQRRLERQRWAFERNKQQAPVPSLAAALRSLQHEGTGGPGEHVLRSLEAAQRHAPSGKRNLPLQRTTQAFRAAGQQRPTCTCSALRTLAYMGAEEQRRLEGAAVLAELQGKLRGQLAGSPVDGVLLNQRAVVRAGVAGRLDGMVGQALRELQDGSGAAAAGYARAEQLFRIASHTLQACAYEERALLLASVPFRSLFTGFVCNTEAPAQADVCRLDSVPEVCAAVEQPRLTGSAGRRAAEESLGSPAEDLASSTAAQQTMVTELRALRSAQAVEDALKMTGSFWSVRCTLAALQAAAHMGAYEQGQLMDSGLLPRLQSQLFAQLRDSSFSGVLVNTVSQALRRCLAWLRSGGPVLSFPTTCLGTRRSTQRCS
ncbi:hypothetical protein WJX81_007643 [Elliptochloris bilobata]|uniref:Uncharacterized protein n=1 Tax=Elliptochloris bilobata TaxID=381761 RepID=A0AAW1RFC9_9CHLO